jgi:hypothetical protein
MAAASPRNDELLIATNVKDDSYYIYNPSHGALGVTYQNEDFLLATGWLAAPEKAIPEREYMPLSSETVDYPDPHLRVSRGRLEFTSLTHRRIVVSCACSPLL